MAIGGGAVTTLVSGSTFTHLGLDNARVFYTSGQNVVSIAKSGGSASVFAAGASTITALFVLPQNSNTQACYGEANGP